MSCEQFKDNECAVYYEHPIITKKEKKCSYRINNPERKKVYRVQIDNCLIKDGKKCDWLFIDCSTNTMYFVELKGHDFIQAVRQILNTIEYIKNHFTLGSVIHARIVHTHNRVPDMKNNPDILNLERKIRKISKQSTFLYHRLIFTDNI